jgi:hypothetical protein
MPRTPSLLGRLQEAYFWGINISNRYLKGLVIATPLRRLFCWLPTPMVSVGAGSYVKTETLSLDTATNSHPQTPGIDLRSAHLAETSSVPHQCSSSLNFHGFPSFLTCHIFACVLNLHFIVKLSTGGSQII